MSKLFHFAMILVLLWSLGGCRRQSGTDSGNADSAPSPSLTATSASSQPGRALARPSPGADPLFRAVPATESGLDFVNAGPIQETNAKGEIVYFRSMSGADTAGGVTIGDIDADGLPDIYLTRASRGNRLYRNLGQFRFEDITERAGLTKGPSWGTGASFADIDNDGDLDLYACGYKCANVLYLNDGRGKFTDHTAAYGLGFIGASVMPAFADYDLDGDLDLYLLTNHLETPGEMSQVPVRVNPATGELEVPPNRRESVGAIRKPDGSIKAFMAGQYDHLLRNELGPDGEPRPFTSVSEKAGIEGTHMGLSVTWWDYNGDSYPDLYVANDFYGPDVLYRNNQNGTFSNVIREAIPHTPWFSMGSDFADIDNDGRLDYMASDMAGSTHYKAKMGMGDMEDQGWFLTVPEPRQYMRNAVYVNTGTERFLEAAYLTGLATTDWTWSVKFADFDNDGWQDLFATNGMTRDLFHSDLKASELALQSKEIAKTFWGKAAEKRDPNLAFRNLGDLQFSPVTAEWGLEHTGISFGAAVADLDGDGGLDLVINHHGEPAGLYQNRSSNPVLRVRLRGTRSNSQGLGARVRLFTDRGEQVRYLSLARGYMSTSETVAHFGVAGATRLDRLTVEWPGRGVQTLTGLAMNQLYTITQPDTGLEVPEAPDRERPALFARSAILDAVSHAESPFDDFERQPLLPNRLSQAGPGMAWGDVDGDGDADLYVGGAAGFSGQLLIREGERFVERAVEALQGDAGSEDMAPLFFDADGDGDIDLYVVSGGVECEPDAAVLQDRLYQNDGAGSFQRRPLPALRESGSVVVAADYDRDGDLDLFVGGRSVPGRWPQTPASHLLRNDGVGNFTSETPAILAATGMVTAALWSDTDRDGWLDLLVAHEWGPVKLFRNDQGRFGDATAAAGLDAWLGWWNGMAGGDFDADGDIDFAVTNFGLNTKYRASAAEPQLLYYGDFDGSGRPHVVEAAVYEGATLPLRGFSCSRNAMPSLDGQLKTFHNFASSTLDGIYGRERLSESVRLEANTLASGILINDSRPGEPRFRFRPLPRLAQIAPSFGVVVLDVNADGHGDLCLAQNSHAPQRETGHMDGGVSLVLLGDGAGEFQALGPDRSGLLIPGDAKALTATDLDGDRRPDLIASVNKEGLRAFLGRSSGRLFTVRVADPGAVGARVRLHCSDGSAQTAECYLGQGYLSQSSQTLTFALGEGNPVRLVVERAGREAESHDLSPAADEFEIR